MITAAPDGSPARRRSARSKGDEREDQILAATRSLLTTRAIDDVTIDDISSAAGISRTSFYFYFPSKQAVLATLIEKVWDEFSDTHDWFDAAGPDPAGLRAQLAAVAGIWQANGPIMACAARAGSSAEYAPIDEFITRARKRFVDRLAAKIDRDRTAGLAPQGPPAVQLAILVAHARDVWLTEFTSADGIDPTTLDALAVTIARMIYGRVD